MTLSLAIDDAYMRDCGARVERSDERGIVVDRTNFYASGGGQPGDTGQVLLTDGRAVEIATTVYGENRSEIILKPATPDVLPEVGARVTCRLDWPRRHAHMRVHTALHLLSVLLPFPVTGGQIAADGGRLDFDIPDADIADKDSLSEQLNALIARDLPVSFEWIADEDLLAKPGLVKTMAVKPPMGTGRVRLVRIGDVDLQPCGGTHVRSTAEIGAMMVSKIEKKGRQNRRVRIAFA